MVSVSWPTTVDQSWLKVAASPQESPGIIRLLVSHEIEVHQVIIHYPNLEEYFIDVTQAEIPDSGRSQMLSLLKAEWKKTTSNRMLSGFLIWIYPIGVGAFIAMMVLVSLLSESSARAMAATSSGQWTTDMLSIWLFISRRFPGNIFGRMLPLAFMAVTFAGEYQWSTWKNVVPRSTRWNLILAKFVTLSSFIMLSLFLTSLILGAGQGLGHALTGAAYGPKLDIANLAELRPYVYPARFFGTHFTGNTGRVCSSFSLIDSLNPAADC